MKKIFYFLILVMLFILPNDVKASCTIQEKARLKKIVSNVNISYYYQIVGNRAVFSIKFNNVNKELYFKDSKGNNYYGSDNGEIVLTNYSAGASYTFNFYGTESCKLEEVGKLYANTPSYNPYYQLSVCDDAKEYSLCQKWVSHSLSRQEFIEKVNEYKQNINIIDDSEINKQISIIDLTMSFIRMYGIYIAIIVTIIIITIKYIRYKKDTFGF